MQMVWQKMIVSLQMNKLLFISVKNAARAFATETVEKQRKEFESWGITADWNNQKNTYRTYDAAYIQNQLNLFYQLYTKKLIFRDLKPVYWSPSSKWVFVVHHIACDTN